ncbi:hypothetical protein [Lacrimispora sp.]|uniref:hypothetical protein n=1 Tax=Lacrimispora sp. TaxID=2719234 RepID=UPI00289C1560|nr:hypothetical protein [Lacrimispora sp.]
MEEMEPVTTQVEPEENKPKFSFWYEGHISLEDAKTFIKANITTAARSFIAIGFYLKCVRDRELFKEEEYETVWDFAKAEYGISKSTASRYMSMNDRFSENGNSPNIREEYRAFGKSQLQEMLYLEDEQLEQVRPGDRVEDIRSLRKPKEVPYIELPGQMEIEIDFPYALPPDQQPIPMISQKQTFEINVEDMLSDGLESVAISQQINDDDGSIPCDSCRHELALDGGNECETCSDFEGFERRYDLEQEKAEEAGQEILPQLESGFYNPDDDSKVDESYSLAGIPRASDRHVTMFAWWFVQENAGMLFHGGLFYGIRDEEIIRMLKLFHYGRETIVIDNDVEVSVGAEIIEFSRGDEDLGICLFQKFVNYVRKQIDEYIEQMAEKERQEKAQEQQSENNQGNGTFNSEPTSCLYREGYSCTLSDEKKKIPGDGHSCGFTCCWSCKFHGMCDMECNASAGRDGELPEYDAAWFVKEWALRFGDLTDVLSICRENINNADRAKAVQELISPFGARCRSCSEYSFSYNSFAGGMDFRVGKVEMHLKYGRFVQELMNLYPDFEESENVPEQDESIPQSSENVIDGEFVEVPSEPETTEYTPQYFLDEQKEKLDKLLRITAGKELLLADIKIIECQKTIVASLACMVAELERPEPESVKQEQPELPLLKNNDQRKEFIENYTTWPLWIETKETGERYYRYNLSDKIAMVVKVSWRHSWIDYKKSEGYEYSAEQYYLLGVGTEWKAGKNVYVEDDTRTFYECNSNMSAMVEYLKEFQKKGKSE